VCCCSLSDRRHLDSADPDAGDPDLPTQATQFLLLVGAAIVIVLERQTEHAAQTRAAEAGRSRASGDRRKHRWRPPARRGPRRGLRSVIAPMASGRLTRAAIRRRRFHAACVDASARPFGLRPDGAAACHDRLDQVAERVGPHERGRAFAFALVPE